MLRSSRIFDCFIDDVLEDADEDCGGTSAEETDDEAVVAVDARLTRLLDEEISRYLESISAGTFSELRACKRVRCELCPFRTFTASTTHWKRGLSTHIDRQHSKKSRRCVGTKQAKLIRALFDYDRFP